MVADGDPLAELAEVVLVEAVAQLRLAEQNDLQQLARVGLEVGKQANLLQEGWAEILRFVDDQHGVAASLDFVEEELVDGGNGVQTVQSPHIQAELHGHGFDQLIGIEDWIEDQGGGEVLSQLLEHGSAKGGL